jgi:hypothetical protein
MKYSVDILIDKPIDTVVALFDDPDNLSKWQPGFISSEHIEGEWGVPGSKYRLKYKMGKRDIEMIETLTVRDLPREMSGTYEAKGVFNIVKNYFEPVSEHQTRWRSDQEFQFKGFMKIIAVLMPRSFKKQSMKYLELFKAYAESQ